MPSLFRAATSLVAGHATMSSLPGLPRCFLLLDEFFKVYEVLVPAQSALVSGATPEVKAQIKVAISVVDSLNLQSIATWDAALQSVEVFLRPINVVCTPTIVLRWCRHAYYL
jgi:hypothetical protein